MLLATTAEIAPKGRRLRVARLGSGPPLVLLHGYIPITSRSGASWREACGSLRGDRTGLAWHGLQRGLAGKRDPVPHGRPPAGAARCLGPRPGRTRGPRHGGRRPWPSPRALTRPRRRPGGHELARPVGRGDVLGDPRPAAVRLEPSDPRRLPWLVFRRSGPPSPATSASRPSCVPTSGRVSAPRGAGLHRQDAGPATRGRYLASPSCTARSPPRR